MQYNLNHKEENKNINDSQENKDVILASAFTKLSEQTQHRDGSEFEHTMTNEETLMLEQQNFMVFWFDP